MRACVWMWWLARASRGCASACTIQYYCTVIRMCWCGVPVVGKGEGGRRVGVAVGCGAWWQGSVKGRGDEEGWLVGRRRRYTRC